ncbi:MAG: hypothetical protein V3R81_05615, partial [Gammaproteobacteria bacterium]
MTFPVIESVADDGNETGNSTTHTINMPPGLTAGDLIVVWLVCDGATTFTNLPVGWVKLGIEGAQPVTAIIYKQYTDEGSSITINTADAETMASKAYRISGAMPASITPPVIGVKVGSSGTNSDPPALTTPWPEEDTLWLALSGNDTTGITFTGYPKGFIDTGFFASGGGAGVTLGYCRKEARSQTIDPSVFTHTDEQWGAQTVAIRPRFDAVRNYIAKRNVLLASAAESVGGASVDGLIRRKMPWTIKPPPGARLDPTNPLCRGLQLVDGCEPVGRDLSQNKYALEASSDTQEVRSGPSGMGVYFDPSAADNTQRRGFEVGTDLSNIAAITVACLHKVTTDGGTTHRLINKHRSGFECWRLMRDSTRQYHFLLHQGAEVDHAAPTAQPTNDFIEHMVIGRYDSNVTHDIWLDGAMLAEDATPSAGNITSRSWAVNVSGQYTGSAIDDDPDGEIHYLDCVWDRALSDAEVRAFSENPWQIFEPRTVIVPLEIPTPSPGFIRREIPWTVKPPEGLAKIAAKYRKNVIACWIFDKIAGTMIDISGNGYDATSGENSSGTFSASVALGPTPITNPLGKGALFDGVRECFEVTSALPSGDRLQQPCSFLYITDWTDSGDSDQRLIDKSDGGGMASGWGLEHHPGTNFIEYKRHNVDGDFRTADMGAGIAGLHTVCLTTPPDGVTAKGEAWFDGKNVRDFGTPSIDTDFTAFSSQVTGVRIGTWNHTEGREWNGSMGLLCIFDHRIPDTEARALSTNPWAIFEPRTQLISIPTAAAAAGGSIDAAGAIASGEAFETNNSIAAATPQAITGTVGAIASGEAFESDAAIAASAVQAITGTVGAIASGEAFEADNSVAAAVHQAITGTVGAIASGEAFEADNVISDVVLAITGTV